MTKCARINCKTRKQDFIVEMYEVNNGEKSFALKPVIGSLQFCTVTHIREFFEQQFDDYLKAWSAVNKEKLHFVIKGRQLPPEKYWEGVRQVINNDLPLEFNSVDALINFFTADGTGFSEWDRYAHKRMEREERLCA